MRSAWLCLLLTGCAAFGPPSDTLETRTATWARMAPHASLECVPERPGVDLCVTDPQNARWLCGQFLWQSPGGCLVVLADRRVMVVPRDDRTGEADPMVLAHERCHVGGGTERDCRRLVSN